MNLKQVSLESFAVAGEICISIYMYVDTYICSVRPRQRGPEWSLPRRQAVDSSEVEAEVRADWLLTAGVVRVSLRIMMSDDEEEGALRASAH